MVNTQSIALIDHARKVLEGLYLQCEMIQSGLIVAACALKFQNAEYDAEIARVLEYGIGDRLHVQLEVIGELIASLNATAPEGRMNTEANPFDIATH